MAAFLLGVFYGYASAAAAAGAGCGPPPKPPYPAVEALPRCGEFPNPWLRSDGATVSTPAEWRGGGGGHRQQSIEMLEHYMYGHAPAQPPVRSTLTGTAEVTEYCQRANEDCNVTAQRCKLRCVPLGTPATLRNYTLRVGPVLLLVNSSYSYE